MRNLYYYFILYFLFVGQAFALSYTTYDTYFLKEGYIYFQDEKLFKYNDSFSTIHPSKYFAVNHNKIYFKGLELRGVNPNEFVVYSNSFAADSSNIYLTSPTSNLGIESKPLLNANRVKNHYLLLYSK